MHSHVTQSHATRVLAAQHTHDGQHPGSIAMAAPTHDDIAHRAYDIYVQDGRKQGQCKQNWRQAEHELLNTNHAS
jgi:hypothetical protein